jgi:hypothetical protein
MIIEALAKNLTMKNNKKRMPTDQQLKSYNPADRDFQRTENETDRVDQSEIDEQKREKKKQERNKQ